MSAPPDTASPLGKPTSGNLGDYLPRVFTPEQEARIRQIVREERANRLPMFGDGTSFQTNSAGGKISSPGNREAPDVKE